MLDANHSSSLPKAMMVRSKILPVDQKAPEPVFFLNPDFD